MSYVFYACSSLKELNISNFDTDNAYDISCMFYGCSTLEQLDISNFRTESIMNIRDIFVGCKSLKNLKCLDAKIREAYIEQH